QGRARRRPAGGRTGGGLGRLVPRGPQPGAAGLHPRRRPPVMNPRLVSLFAPASFEAEQYRGLRLRLASWSEERPLQIIAVTSAAPGEGKTTTAINLAGALAQARASRVLLVDADLRRPGVAAQLGLADSRGAGLADALLDEERSLESVVLRRL